MDQAVHLNGGVEHENTVDLIDESVKIVPAVFRRFEIFTWHQTKKPMDQTKTNKTENSKRLGETETEQPKGIPQSKTGSTLSPNPIQDPHPSLHPKTPNSLKNQKSPPSDCQLNHPQTANQPLQKFLLAIHKVHQEQEEGENSQNTF